MQYLYLLLSDVTACLFVNNALLLATYMPGFSKDDCHLKKEKTPGNHRFPGVWWTIQDLNL